MRHRFLLAVSLVLTLNACGAKSPGGNPGGEGGEGGEGGAPPGTGGAPPKDAGTATGGSGGKGTGGATTGGAGGSTGGAGGSAGATGGGGGNAPPDAGTSADGPPATMGNLCAGAKKCFDFEDQTPGQAPSSPDFKVEMNGGSMSVDSAKFFSGKQSIKISTRGGTNFPGTNLVFSGVEKLLPENDMHGRVMMWMANTPGRAHWDSILGSAAGGANPTYILGGMYMNFMSVYHPGDDSVDSATPFPTGTWACIQWQFSGKGGMNIHKMMLNGQVVDKGLTTKWRAPTFSQLKVGYRHFNTNVAVDVWLDDLAFGDQPIPCPPKM